MRCPNCSLEQPDGAAECSGCQIIFEKWYRKQASAQTAASPAAAAPAAAPGGGSSTALKAVVISALVAAAGPLIWKLGVKKAVERYVVASLEMNKTEDPVSAAAAAGEIISFEIPGGAEGVASSHAGLLGIRAKVAVVGSKQSGVMLLLMAFSGLEESDTKGSVGQFKEKLAGRLRIEKSEVRKGRIAGEPADITVDRGYLPVPAESSPTGKPVDLPMISYLGQAKCADDDIIIWSMGFGDNGEASVSSVFDSLRCKTG